MLDGSEKRNRQLAFERQNSHVCEKRSKQCYIPGTISLRAEKGSDYPSAYDMEKRTLFEPLSLISVRPALNNVFEKILASPLTS